MDNSFLFVSPSMLEHKRYFRFFCSDVDDVIWYQDFSTLRKFYRIQDSTTWVVVNGLRFPDKVLIKLCVYKNWNVVILQHNATFQKYTLYEKLKKIWYGLGKYSGWLGFTLLMVAVLMPRPRGRLGQRYCYCFSQQFADEVRKIVTLENVEVLSWPDMRVYGADVAKLSSQTLEFFFVDEPFEQTLGIQSELILEQALKILPERRTLHVKLHPRSSAQKYANGGPNVAIVDSFPKGVEVLFTYNSNLGKFYSPERTRYVFSKAEKKFLEDTSCVVSNQADTEYVEECAARLTKLR